MKKLIIIVCLLLPAAISLKAQPKDSTKTSNVEIEINGNKVTLESNDLSDLSQVDLNSIIREVTSYAMRIQSERQELLAEVKKQLENGEITREQADDMTDMINDRAEESLDKIGDIMDEWGDKYSEKVEAWQEENEDRMEQWKEDMKKQSAEGNFQMPPMPPLPDLPAMPAPRVSPDQDTTKEDKTIIIDENGITIRNGKNGEKPFALRFKDENKDNQKPDQPSDKPKKIERTDGYFDVNFGFNQQLRNGNEFIYDTPDELKFWGSNDFNIGFGWKTRIGSPLSKIYIRYGGEFSFNDFKLRDNNLLEKTNNRAMIVTDSTRSISYSKYKVSYFDIPVMFQLDCSKAGNMDDSFTLGIGGYAGLRMATKRKLEYSDDLHKAAKETLKDEFFTNPFRYGLMAQVGWGSFKVTGRYDLNKFFRPDKGPDYQLASLTIGWTL